MRFCLVGCGRIAHRHADLLGGGQIEGAELVAVCDIDQELAASFGRKYAVPNFSDMRKMVELVSPDVIVVLSESGNHARHVIELSSFGCHIVVEKPMALRLPDADEMIAACRKNNVRLFVVKQNRFNVPIVKTREALEAGRFGKLVLGTVRVRWCRQQSYYDQAPWRGTWAMDGGVITNQASHHIDLLQWFFGDVESVYAKSTRALADIETEDTAVALLKFRNGALGVIEATTAARPTDLEGSLSILGEGGAVEIGGFAVNQMKTWRFADHRPEDGEVIAQFSVNPPNVYGFGHKAYYEHVVDCISTGRNHMVDGTEGRKSLEIINAIYEAVETGRDIHLPFRPQRSRLGERAL